MPLYDYECSICGAFRAFRAMRDASAPMACPSCGTDARKTVTAPFLADMNPSRRLAHARNERSMHEPAVVRRTSHEHVATHTDCAHPQHHGVSVSAGLGPGPWIQSPHRTMVGHH